MRIAMVCPYDLGRVGGVQDQASKLCTWLQGAGHDAWLVGPGTSGPAGARLVGPVTVVTANGSATPISLSPSAWRRTIEAVADADVVHIHEPFMPVVSQAATAAAPPKVGTFHADPSRTVRRLYRVAGPVLRRVAGRLDVATAVSPIAEGALGGIVEMRAIPNAVEVASYAPLPKVSHRVVFLGRDDPRKGLGVLLEAWPKVASRVPGAELVVAGPPEARPEAPPRVRFVGRVDEDAKRRLLGEAAVFCAPNTGGESFGIVLVEAMASGCAVVASGLPAFVQVAGDAAQYVAPGDAGGLGDALTRLLLDRGRRDALAAAARERLARFDAPQVVSRYVEAYEDAVAAHTG